MKIGLLSLLLFSVFFANSQTIKMKISGVTAAAGEDVIAFQIIDTLPLNSNSGGGAMPRVNIGPVQVKKLYGASTNELWKRNINGTQLQEVSFEFYDAAAVMFYKMVLKEVYTAEHAYLSPECSGCAKLYNQLSFVAKRYEVTDVATNTTIKYNVATSSFYN